MAFGRTLAAIAPYALSGWPASTYRTVLFSSGTAVQPRRSLQFEQVPRPVVGVGFDFSESLELAEHSHARGQLLYAASGVIVARTPQGAWVAPPERAVWIPATILHTVYLVGAVQARGVLIDTAAYPDLPRSCRVVGVSPLLRQLLVAAADIPAEYEMAGRDGLVMQLLLEELCSAPLIPIAVPLPRHTALAALCRAFLEQPAAGTDRSMGPDAGAEPPKLHPIIPSRNRDEHGRMATTGQRCRCSAEAGGRRVNHSDCPGSRLRRPG